MIETERDLIDVVYIQFWLGTEQRAGSPVRFRRRGIIGISRD